MNLLLSLGAVEDHALAAAGHLFLGAGHAESLGEVHVFLHKDHIAKLPIVISDNSPRVNAAVVSSVEEIKITMVIGKDE